MSSTNLQPTLQAPLDHIANTKSDAQPNSATSQHGAKEVSSSLHALSFEGSQHLSITDRLALLESIAPDHRMGLHRMTMS